MKDGRDRHRRRIVKEGSALHPSPAVVDLPAQTCAAPAAVLVFPALRFAAQSVTSPSALGDRPDTFGSLPQTGQIQVILYQQELVSPWWPSSPSQPIDTSHGPCLPAHITRRPHTQLLYFTTKPIHLFLPLVPYLLTNNSLPLSKPLEEDVGKKTLEKKNKYVTTYQLDQQHPQSH